MGQVLVEREERGSLVISQRTANRRSAWASLNTKSMKILRVVGFAMLIISLKFLVPRVFSGLENTLVMFFDAIQRILTLTGKYPLTAGFIPQ